MLLVASRTRMYCTVVVSASSGPQGFVRIRTLSPAEGGATRALQQAYDRCQAQHAKKVLMGGATSTRELADEL